MMVGDLVWAYGCRGLILQEYQGMYTTEYFVYWFDNTFEPTWIVKKHLIKVC